MSYLDQRVYSNGLNVLDTEANVLHICSSEPASFGAVAGVSLGTKTGLSIGAISARSGGGWKVTVASFTDGAVSASGTATHYAIVDTTNSRLLAANSLPSSQPVTGGNTFTLGAFDIGIPAPV